VIFTIIIFSIESGESVTMDAEPIDESICGVGTIMEDGIAVFVGPYGEFNEIIVYPTLDHNNEINPEEFQNKIFNIIINFQKIDERSAQQPLTIKTDKYRYGPGDSVTINVDTNFPILAAISVIDLQQETILLRSMQIENFKQLSFTIPQNWLTGIRDVVLSTTINNEVYLISEEFFVTSNVDEHLEDVEEMTKIPNWIKNNVKWWSEKQIGDNDFVSGIEYMIKEGIIKVPYTKTQQSSELEIPDWVRNNAQWWVDGIIPDNEFVSGLEYLIKIGVIRT